MFKLLPKSKYPIWMLYFLTEHTLIIYVQYIKSSKRKTSHLFEKLFEKDLVHFISISISKRLKLEYSSSDTVSNQKIKIKYCFLDDCVFLEIRLTHGNQLLQNITRNKWETAFSNLFKKHETPLVNDLWFFLTVPWVGLSVWLWNFLTILTYFLCMFTERR